MKLAIIYFRVPPLNLVSSCIMIPIMLKVGHKCNYYSILIYSAIVVMLTMTADALGVLLTSWVQDQTISVAVTEIDLSLQRHLINWMLQIIFTRIVILLIKKNSAQSCKWHEAFFYLFLVVFEIGIYIYVSYVIQEYSKGYFLIIMMLGFLVLDLYMIYILHKIALTRETEYQLQMMHQQSNLQLHLYQELQNKYALSRSVAHDIERHINSLTK